MAERVCLWCGKRFQPHWGEKHCCIQCFEAHEESKGIVYREAPATHWKRKKVKSYRCERCGSIFTSTGNSAKYCPKCRPEVHRQRVAAGSKKRDKAQKESRE